MTGTTGRTLTRWITRLALGLVLVLLASTPAHALQRAFGYCEDGNQSITTGSLTSSPTTKVQRSYPGCTITVFVSGTATLATIYADTLLTPLANPFTLGPTASGYWFFYAADGHYDVQFSGAGIATPFAHGDYLLQDNAGLGYYDLREAGAVCDGVTNINAAVLTAIARGFSKLYLPANCLWTPTANNIPGSLDVMGQSPDTSKIWASPTSAFLNIGPMTRLQNINANGLGCNFQGTPDPLPGGCRTYNYYNFDSTHTEPMQMWPWAWDVGNTSFSAGTGIGAQACIQRGDAACFYGQFNGLLDNSAGAGVQTGMAYNGGTGAGLMALRFADGVAFRVDDLPGSEGVTHAPQPSIWWRSLGSLGAPLAKHGNAIEMLQQGSLWDGYGLYMRFAQTGGPGNFVGAFTRFDNSQLPMYLLDYQGNQYKAGIDGVWSGVATPSGAALVMSGQMMSVSGAATITTIALPPNSNFVNLMGFPTRQSFCIDLLGTPGSTWSLATGGNIAAAATIVAGHHMRVCYDNLTALWYPQ